MSSYTRLGLPNGLFLVDLSEKILKAFLSSCILATWPAHLNLLDLITLCWVNGTNYEIPHCGAFSTPNFYPYWAQIFTSRSYFRIPLACVPPVMFHNNIAQLACIEKSIWEIRYNCTHLTHPLQEAGEIQACSCVLQWRQKEKRNFTA